MSEQSVCKLFGAQTVEALADLSSVLAGGPQQQTLGSGLRLLCEMFDSEGAVLWLLDETQQALARHLVVHRQERRSKAFEQLAAEEHLHFGQSLAGQTWAKGEPLLVQQPAMFAQTPAPSASATGSERKVNTIGLPLLGGGTISGVVAIIGASVEKLEASHRQILQIVGLSLGSFIYAQTASDQIRLYEDQLGKLTAETRLQELDLKEAKNRLSKEHEKAVQASRFNAEFLKKISNDVRTPLNGITGIIDLLGRTRLDEQQTEYAGIIRESAGVLLNVADDLIAYSNQEVQFFTPDPAEAMKTAAEHIEETEKYLADAKVLIVAGLIGSAEFIEAYTTSSGIRSESVSRGYSALTAMRQALRAGDGFDIAFVEMVLPDMDAYEFARIVRQDKQLAQTKLILVSTFGASASDDQAMSAGFAAHVAKPTKQMQVINIISAVLEDVAYIEEPATEPQMNVTPAAVTGKPMILVAEDNPVNQKVALLQLKELGFYAKVVTNGQECVEAVKEGIYDAVLMDLQMPKMDGFEATRQIRQWEKKTGTHIPVIAMTAQAMSADKERSLAAGMDDYMSKPVTYDKLSSVLSQWISLEDPEEDDDHYLAFETQEDKTMQFSPEKDQGQTDRQMSAPIDVSSLVEMLGPDETAEILALFVSSTENLLNKINNALDTHDAQSMKEAAHELKGACSSVGADNMAETCKQIEAALKASDWDSIGPLHNRLAESFDNARTYINNRFS